MSTPARHLTVRGTYNLRDLGGYTTAQGTQIPWRRFLRADCLHRLEDGEASRLHFEGLRQVVDLRTPAEVMEAPSLFGTHPGVEFVNLPLFGALSPAALAEGEAPDGHPLLAFYVTAIETRGTAIRDILSRISEVREGAVLFNCTAGKDRTGIIAALLLGIAGVTPREIVADYAMTEALIPDLVAQFLDASRARGGDVEAYARLLESPASTMAGFLSYIDATYGSVMGYMDHIDLPLDAAARLQSRLGLTG
ncbi:tyrosine-protein phosphatase [uncultured Sulfitobacter sp.]|uniref:tyrosine-protein phosphatase n=1 Tax=uncultured Sulfitobacter sp. TaxID=191468 RepID=UPI0026037837|nr:tyrosine-protein phosphatase [uncultured Sulfitobacter sp.]